MKRLQFCSVLYSEKPDKDSETKIQPASKIMLLLKLNFLPCYRTKLQYSKDRLRMEINPQKTLIGKVAKCNKIQQICPFAQGMAKQVMQSEKQKPLIIITNVCS